LLKFWEQYRLPRSLHCKVALSIDYKTIPPGIVRTDDTDEFWADGDKYRIVNQIDSAVHIGISHDVRWNGELFQTYNLLSGVLIVTKHPNQKTPYLALPVPLIPWAFLAPTGTSESVKTTLADVRSDATRARRSDAIPTNADGTEFQFHIGQKFGVDCTYFIEFHGVPSFAPSRLTLRTAAGINLAISDFTYQPVHCAAGTVYLPSVITCNTRNLLNRPEDTEIFTVTEIDADKPIPAEIFTIDYQTAKRVIDLDSPSSPLTLYNPAAPPTGIPTTLPAVAASPTFISPGVSADPETESWPMQNVLIAALGICALLTGVAIAFYRKSLYGGGR
jgi:hypothetical protein